jgi:23S rRNA pseudouridine1911/1915/1917 synthase
MVLPMTEFSDQTNEDQELFEHYRFQVDPGQSPLRVDKYLMHHIENASRSRLQTTANNGNILINGEVVKPSYKVRPGDVITIVMAEPARSKEMLAEDIPIEILYEDDDLIVVNKYAGMVVHPAHGNFSGTLVNALLWHFQKGSNDEKKAKPGPYLVHRIDKNTSGVMLIARNEIAQAKISEQFFDHSIERKYNALVWGDFDEDEGTIEGHVGRSLKNRKMMTVFPEGEYGKSAITHYRVTERFGYVTLVECQLETGRTHQIRAHMRYIGHPLFNDETYGGSRVLKGTTFTKYKQFVKNCFAVCPRQALHARTLGFIHPSTGEKMLFEAPFPDDMQQLLEKWANYAVHKALE